MATKSVFVIPERVVVIPERVVVIPERVVVIPERVVMVIGKCFKFFSSPFEDDGRYDSP